MLLTKAEGWNIGGIILVILALATGFMWAFDIIEYERAVLAILIMVIFGLVFVGTCCMGILNEIKWRNLNVKGKK